MTLAEKLAEVYLYEEGFHEEKMWGDEAVRYYQWVLDNGQCITVCDDKKLAGYVEFYRQNEICFIRGIYIRPEYRRGDTIKMLRDRLFQVCKGCTEFKGRRHKRDRIELRRA